MTREELLRRGLSEAMAVLEIGPFYAPVAPKADGWNTTVVDFTDQAALLAIARSHSAESIRESAHRIEQVDIVWRREPLDVLGLRIRPEGYDFLIASHVIEHVPDIVGFLQQTSRLLTDVGIISLAVPDMRFCFDFFKPLSNTPAALAAYREGRTIHSPETVLEAQAYPAFVAGSAAWLRNDGRPAELGGNDLQSAFANYQEYARRAHEGSQEYVDAHTWKFVPASFELMILELNCLGLSDWKIARIEEAESGSEFTCQLQRERVSLGPGELNAQRQILLQRTVLELGKCADRLVALSPGYACDLSGADSRPPEPERKYPRPSLGHDLWAFARQLYGRRHG